MLFDVLQEKRVLILNIASEHGIQRVRVFGSVARREEGSESDLDLLVNFEIRRSLFDLIRFKEDIEELLHIRVDVVTEDSLHSSISQSVINGAVDL